MSAQTVSSLAADSGAPLSALAVLDALKEKGASPADTYRQVNRYLESKARREGIPLHGTLELTPRCNLDCKMCYVHLSGRQGQDARVLPTETWIGLIDQARAMGLLRISLSGGECLTHPGFDEIYMHLYNHGIRTHVLTNGVLLDEKRAAFFRRCPPGLIQVTLYGGSEEEYEAVTGHRVFSRIVENLTRLKEADLRVMLSVTPNPFMHADIRPLLHTAQRLGFPWQVNCALVSPRPQTGRTVGDLSADRYVEISRAKLEVLGEKLYDVDPACLPLPNRRLPDAPLKGFRCGAGRSGFVIQPDGRMSPCVGLTGTATEPLKTGFREAWKALFEIARDWPVPNECPDCAYARQCTMCPAIHQNAPAGHCDRRICDRTLKLAAAGILRSPLEKEPCA